VGEGGKKILFTGKGKGCLRGVFKRVVLRKAGAKKKRGEKKDGKLGETGIGRNQKNGRRVKGRLGSLWQGKKREETVSESARSPGTA